MNYYFWSGVINAATSCFVVALVFFRNRRRRANQIFMVFAGSVAFWAICYAIWVWTMSYSEAQSALFWIRWAMIGSTVIPPAFTEFVIHLLNHDKRWKKARLFNLSLMGVILIFSFSSLFIKNVGQIMMFRFWPIPGPLFYVFHAWFGANVLISHYLLIESLWKTKGTIVWKRNLSVFLGTFLGFLGGMTNHFLWYGIKIPPVGNILVAVYVATVAFSIVRYQFLDIEVIIKKTLVFAGIVAAAVVVISLPLGLIQLAVGKKIGVSPFWLMVSGIATTALIYRPLAKWLTNLTDKYLFQKKVSYRKLLKEATEYLAHLKSLKRQARRIVTFLVYKARIANVSLYAYQSFAPGSLLLQASYPRSKINGHKTIALSHPLASFLNTHRSAIELYSIREEKAEEKDPVKISEFDAIMQLFKEHDAEAIIPCFGSDAAELARRTKLHLRGILFLGHQKSDQPYSEEDLDVFFTLGQESSIAFENARLFDEAKTRAAELAKANEELKHTNAELMRLNKQLKEVQTELMETKQRALVAGMGRAIAHEVNNPLSSVMTPIQNTQKALDELQALHEACESNPTERNRKSFFVKLEAIKEGLARARGGADRIRGIITTLGDLVKTPTNEKKPVQLKLIVKCAWEEVKYQTYYETMGGPESYGLAIPHDLPYVRGIAHDLQGVFTNLFINALHALEKRQRDKKIDVEARVEPDNPEMVRIDFSDNGCGMTPEVLAKCFEQGYTTKGVKGTGIGLHYVKYVIEQRHGGSIDAKSDVGVGTTFIINLPRYKEEGK